MVELKDTPGTGSVGAVDRSHGWTLYVVPFFGTGAQIGLARVAYVVLLRYFGYGDVPPGFITSYPMFSIRLGHNNRGLVMFPGLRQSAQ